MDVVLEFSRKTARGIIPPPGAGARTSQPPVNGLVPARPEIFIYLSALPLSKAHFQLDKEVVQITGKSKVLPGREPGICGETLGYNSGKICIGRQQADEFGSFPRYGIYRVPDRLQPALSELDPQMNQRNYHGYCGNDLCDEKCTCCFHIAAGD